MVLAALAVLASVLPVNAVTDVSVARGSCVLVQRVSTEHGVALYFLTAASLFRGADGERFTLQTVTVEHPDGSPISIMPSDVILPVATIVNLAILKATVVSTDLVPRPLAFAPPAAETFRILGPSGAIEEAVRFQSTILLIGDHDLSSLDRCLGAPAVGADGVFGVVADCQPNRTPTIALLSIAQPFLSEHIPGLGSEVGTHMTPLRVFGPTISVPCGELRAGDVDVPFDRPAMEVPVYATATVVHGESIRLADVTVLKLDDRQVKLRFTLAGTPPPPSATTCQPGQALINVRIDLVTDRTPGS